jgi:RimJ/RimL family protein N-acetyltransferase
MLVRSSKTLVGYWGFFHQRVDDTTEIEIGCRLRRDFWNRGLATEAARAVRDHDFRDLKLERVISLIHPENRPSRVAQKNGMILERETTFRGFDICFRDYPAAVAATEVWRRRNSSARAR